MRGDNRIVRSSALLAVTALATLPSCGTRVELDRPAPTGGPHTTSTSSAGGAPQGTGGAPDGTGGSGGLASTVGTGGDGGYAPIDEGSYGPWPGSCAEEAPRNVAAIAAAA